MAKVMKRVVVTGAGGFIGHHLVAYLKKKGFWVRGVDIKRPEYEKTKADEFLLLDLRERQNAERAVSGMQQVYNLAANMGGVGFLDTNHNSEVMHDNVLINVNLLEAARKHGIERFFFSSSACIYPKYKQEKSKNLGLREMDAYPADPDNEYGWEKLFTERLCANYYKEYGLETRVARFHNVYGPLGTWQGGREKSPAALCRKIAMARDGETIEVWGDGRQSRSYCFIDDCVEGIFKLMSSSVREPINIGSSRLVTISELIDIIAKIAKKRIKKKYDKSKPQGVRGRNSDNTKIKRLLRWEPSIPLEVGLRLTYAWIKKQVESQEK